MVGKQKKKKRRNNKKKKKKKKQTSKNKAKVTPESEAIGRKVYKALMVAYETGEILDMEKALQIPLEETEKVAEY